LKIGNPITRDTNGSPTKTIQMNCQPKRAKHEEPWNFSSFSSALCPFKKKRVKKGQSTLWVAIGKKRV